MKLKPLRLMGTLFVPLACGNVDELTVEALAPQAVSGGEVFKIGVLVDNSHPSKNNYIAAANLAESQLNDGLDRAGSDHRFDVIVASYGAGQAQSAALNLINNQGVLGIVTDTDTNSALVNGWNYDAVPPTARQVPVTCYQCSSPRFNNEDEPVDDFRDPDNWLWRTFFNARFDAAVQAHLVLRRARNGDLNNDGHIKVVVYHENLSDYVSYGIAVQATMDALTTRPHTTERVSRSSFPADDMETIFDSDPDGHRPDVVVLAFRSENAAGALADYKNHPLPPGTTTQPPVQMNDQARREHLRPALLAAGGEGVEGASVFLVANNNSGPIFRNAFRDANGGQQPHMTSSYLYDGVVTQAGAIGWAFHLGSTDPLVIQGNFPNVNDPSGRIIRPRPADYEIAVRRIDQDEPINYEGAGSSDDLDPADGENYPNLVRWRIQNGVFTENQVYRCDLQFPNCRQR